MGLLTVMTGRPHVTCVITVTVKCGPGLRAFSSVFTVVRKQKTGMSLVAAVPQSLEPHHLSAYSSPRLFAAAKL